MLATSFIVIALLGLIKMYFINKVMMIPTVKGMRAYHFHPRNHAIADRINCRINIADNLMSNRFKIPLGFINIPKHIVFFYTFTFLTYFQF